MTFRKELIDEIVPQMYESVAEDFNYPPHANVAASNQCHVLTKALHGALKSRGIESRRELHQTPAGVWHYVIAHAPINSEVSADDVITDLNPWQFMEHPPAHYTFLHDSREAIIEKLTAEGAPDYFVALRSLATVSQAHTEELKPPQH